MTFRGGTVQRRHFRSQLFRLKPVLTRLPQTQAYVHGDPLRAKRNQALRTLLGPGLRLRGTYTRLFETCLAPLPEKYQLGNYGFVAHKINHAVPTETHRGFRKV